MTYGGDHAASGCARALGFKSGRLKRVLLRLSLTDIAEDRNDILICFVMSGERAVERSAPHFDPDKLAGAPHPDISLNTKFKRASVTRACRIGECGQKRRSVGDMYALEKAVSEKSIDGNAK